MRRSNIVGALVMSVAALTGVSGAAEVVTNGGFETGDFTGWSLSGDTGFTGVGNFAGPHSGSNEAYFGPVFGWGSMSQVLPLSSGSVVNISFWVANPFGGTPNGFSADFDGANLMSLSDAGGFGYTQFVLNNYVVVNNNPVLSFSTYHPPAYYTLDDISVQTVNAVPLPTGAGLGMAGLLGFAARRRRA